VAKEAAADKIVFIGDYFDTHHAGVSGNKQLVNFKEILAFKREHPEQVVMLFGSGVQLIILYKIMTRQN
jgi:hypothetical protein